MTIDIYKWTERLFHSLHYSDFRLSKFYQVQVTSWGVDVDEFFLRLLVTPNSVVFALQFWHHLASVPSALSNPDIVDTSDQGFVSFVTNLLQASESEDEE